MDELNSFQRDCLYVIAGMDDPYGTAIKEELGQYYASEVFHARLYPALDALAAEGLISKAKRDGRTNVYSLTDAGRRAIADRRQWEDRYVDDVIQVPA